MTLISSIASTIAEIERVCLPIKLHTRLWSLVKISTVESLTERYSGYVPVVGSMTENEDTAKHFAGFTVTVGSVKLRV